MQHSASAVHSYTTPCLHVHPSSTRTALVWPCLLPLTPRARNKMAAKRSTTRFLAALREHLKSKKYHGDVISAYIIPTSDAHQVCA